MFITTKLTMRPDKGIFASESWINSLITKAIPVLFVNRLMNITKKLIN